jgi:hypothetical protein
LNNKKTYEGYFLESKPKDTLRISNIVNSEDTKKNDFTKKNVILWSEEDVKEWLIKIEVNENIKTILNAFNGELLVQMNNMRINAPEFFYSSLRTDGVIDLNSMIKFTNELTKLSF